MVRIINNNLWSPIPWGWGCGGHHSCGANNWMSNMLKYNFMFQIMNNMQNIGRCYATAPQQQSYLPMSGYSPYAMMGLNIGGGGAMPQNYEDYLQQQQDKQDFEQLKASYSGFKFTNIGGEYQARLTSNPSVRFSGSTPLELMEAMDEYIDEHPEDFKSKPAERKERVDASDVKDEPDNIEDKDNSTVKNDGQGELDNTQRKIKTGWQAASEVESDYLKARLTKENLATRNNSAGAVAMYLMKEWKCTDKDIDQAKLKQAIIEQNKSVFQNSGELLDTPNMDRLDLPSLEWAKTNCAKETPDKAGTPAKNGVYIVRMVCDIRSIGTSTVSATLPDTGEVVKYEYTAPDNATRQQCFDKCKTGLNDLLKEKGYSNIILQNKNFDLNSNQAINDSLDKSLSYFVRIVYDRDSKVASVTTPDGTTHYAKDGNADTFANGKSYLTNIIKGYGWTNTTITDTNKTW